VLPVSFTSLPSGRPEELVPGIAGAEQDVSPDAQVVEPVAHPLAPESQEVMLPLESELSSA
jgi:hypothetical protein